MIRSHGQETITLVPLLALALAAACSAKTPPTTLPAARGGSAAATMLSGRCPPTPPNAVGNVGIGRDQAMAPLAATKLVVCRYSFATPPATPPVSPRPETITDPHVVSAWRTRVNDLPVLPSSSTSMLFCPDERAMALLGFLRADTSVVVWVDSDGCGLASNGVRAASATPQLRAFAAGTTE